MRGLRGVIALMGHAPHERFSDYFGAPKPAFQNSLTAIGGSVLLIMVAARYIILLRRQITGEGAVLGFPALQIGITALLYLLAFTWLAFMAGAIFDRRDDFWRWATVRHWMVFYALIPTSLALVLAKLGIFPIMLANGLVFTLFISWLFADVRLAYKLGDVGIIPAVFIACMVHAVGVLVILTAVVQMIP